MAMITWNDRLAAQQVKLAQERQQQGRVPVDVQVQMMVLALMSGYSTVWFTDELIGHIAAALYERDRHLFGGELDNANKAVRKAVEDLKAL